MKGWFFDLRRSTTRLGRAVQRTYRVLAPHAHSVILAGALLCTLAAKWYHAVRCGIRSEYPVWVLSDLSVLLGLEAVLALICYRWPRTWVIRSATALAAGACLWSVINAAWVIRMGVQILPVELLPLIRDPLDHLGIIGVNLVKMPGPAIALLGPSAVALVFVLAALARPVRPAHRHPRLFAGRIVLVALFICLAIPARETIAARTRPSQVPGSGLRYNSQLRAITSIVVPDYSPIDKEDLLNARRIMPAQQQVLLPGRESTPRLNVVMVILESVQYAHTGLADPDRYRTPFLRSFAEQGVEFTQMRSTLTHTTKAIFALLSGRYPCASQDVVEALPADRPYASLATILKRQAGYRTAFFQSAKGNFESRPSLVKNLGFDRFWARENLDDPNRFVGYLGSDEFAMIDPLAEWIESGDRPFLATLMTSVVHDPYEVPQGYGVEPAKEAVDRYDQAITYTDAFLKALDARLEAMGLKDQTLVCIVSDHGEGFGEHGKRGHERIGFEEVLRIVWTLRSPQGVAPGTRIDRPVSSVDVTPTILALLGFDPRAGSFDGADAMAPLPEDRRIFFSGWVPEGPAGYLIGDRKVIYNPAVQEVSVYDLARDPGEINGLILEADQARQIVNDIVAWRKSTLFRPLQDPRGRRIVFDRWQCRWAGRDPVTRQVDETF